jgi:hypothetical protein
MTRPGAQTARRVPGSRPRQVGDFDRDTPPLRVALTRQEALARLRAGELEPLGRLATASNASFYCALSPPATVDGPEEGPEEAAVACVYKPVRGERPLLDFPARTLSRREVAAFLVSEASGWDIVPPTVFRDGPLGPGMVQLWIEVDERIDPVDLIRASVPALRRMAVFDAVVNNADRKVGHLLPVGGGHVYGVDHGICFSTEPKLRTVLWGWRGEPITAAERRVLERLTAALAGDLGRALGDHLAPIEVASTQARLADLLRSGCLPRPDPDRPAIPWPPY